MSPESSAIDFRALPLYDGILDRAAFPDTVTRLEELIAGTDSLALATPKYNFSIPGVLNNAFDWIFRPPAESTRSSHSFTNGASK